jgi:acyl-homoserine-lactone acylase
MAALNAAPRPEPATALPGVEWLANVDAERSEQNGSNAWAFGAAGSVNGRGLLLANPHYPWYGTSRFWEKHLEIPGRLYVYGANLVGAPGVSIGFNRHIAWSHTVSASQRVVYYRLELLAEDPTRYRHGETLRDLEAREFVILVGEGDGPRREHRQTVWFSHHGPIVALPDMPWTSEHAWAARDANVGNYASIEQWRDMGEADGMDALIEAHRRWNAMPWVNTIASSHDGRAVYMDGSTVGHLSDAAIALWHEQQAGADPAIAAAWRQRGMVVLDGSDPRFDWVETEGQSMPTTPFATRPFLERSDYVFNANDSYWMSHGREMLDGFPPLYGPVATPRSLRTRMNALLLEGRTEPRFADGEGRFSMRQIQEALMANQSLAASLLLSPLVEACRADASSGEGSGEAPGEASLDLGEACEVLANFDGQFALDRPGAVLFREWLTRYPIGATTTRGDLFAEAFSPEQPIDTPTGLAHTDGALERLAEAIRVLQVANLPLDARLADTQFAWRGDRPIAVPGGNGHEGVANLMVSGRPDWPTASVTPNRVADSRFLTDVGYPVVHGTSFVLVVGWDDDGPVAEALLTYGQSGDPLAATFIDQTEWFGEGRWRPVRFTREAIEADIRSRKILE